MLGARVFVEILEGGFSGGDIAFLFAGVNVDKLSFHDCYDNS